MKQWLGYLRTPVVETAAAAIWAAAAGTLAWEYSSASGFLAAVMAALLAYLLAPRVANTRFRYSFLAVGGVLSWMVLAYGSSLFRNSILLANIFGPDLAYSTSEALWWFGTTLTVSGLIQIARRRRAIFAALEIACLVAVVASIFAAHRDGAVNRPFFLVDPLWTRGYDPLLVLGGIGVGLAAILFFSLAARSRTGGGRRAGIRDFGLIFTILMIIFALLPSINLRQRTPPSAGGEGGKKEQKKGGRQSKGGKSDDKKNASNNKDFDFNDQDGGGQPQPLAIVVMHDDYDPPSGMYYFRETTFSRFNGQRLVRDSSGGFDQDVAETFPTGSQTMKVDGRSENPLRTTVALLTNDARPLAMVNAFRLTALANPDPRRFYRAYDVESYVLRSKWSDMLFAGVGSQTWSQETWQHYLELPNDRRYLDLAREAVAMLNPALKSNTIAQAIAVTQWLSKNGIYSLKSTHGAASDPVADFLFGDRTGYCVYFAHSAVYMFRSLGIPARVGGGYAAPARRRGRGSSVLIRQTDAHAWPEIYVQNRGWVVLDVSPERTLEPPPPPVDAGLQQMMGDMARKSPLNNKNLQAEEPENGKSVWPQIRQYLAIALALALLALYGVKLWRRIAVYVCDERRLPKVAYRAMLDRIAEAGRVRSFAESRESFARRNLTLCPALADMTQIHMRATLGRKPAPADRGSYLKIQREATAQLSGAVPLWRRMIGALNPLSWWKVC